MLTTVISATKYIGDGRSADFSDRLHCFFTSNLLVALAVLVSFKQFGGQPIECMVPDMFSRAWEQYAENFCWAQDTYFLPFDEEMPREIAERENRRISYYQWVPFFLLVEAICFRLPSLFWRCFASHSGIRIHDIIKMATDERNVQPDVKTQNVKALAVHLQNALRFHRRLYRKRVTPHRILRFLNLPYTATYVSTMYLVSKALYMINVSGQLILMNRFLETDRYSLYGFGALADVLNGTTWEKSGIFPRVTLCDFQVRVMGNVQRYSVQCVLVINIFNEKIFIFLWFWYVVLFFVTTCSLAYWVCMILLPWPSRWFVSRHLELSEMPFDPKGSEKDVERFVTSYLKTDGVFILRMITIHSGVIFGTDLVLSLWCSFYGIEEKLKRKICEFETTESSPPSLAVVENRLNALLKHRFRKFNSEMVQDQKKAPSCLPSDKPQPEQTSLLSPTALPAGNNGDNECYPLVSEMENYISSKSV
ncbi:unnamed protein product [Soboliphyme baturini]|uniref:Innexin n=1 Tax=Soboliphyme baturini TaxID=241478 RepID=A0A183INN5_9BILA|nr:unnamed protein product [Soboliphyme baturini]